MQFDGNQIPLLFDANPSQWFAEAAKAQMVELLQTEVGTVLDYVTVLALGQQAVIFFEQEYGMLNMGMNISPSAYGYHLSITGQVPPTATNVKIAIQLA